MLFKNSISRLVCKIYYFTLALSFLIKHYFTELSKECMASGCKLNCLCYWLFKVLLLRNLLKIFISAIFINLLMQNGDAKWPLRLCLMLRVWQLQYCRTCLFIVGPVSYLSFSVKSWFTEKSCIFECFWVSFFLRHIGSTST